MLNYATVYYELRGDQQRSGLTPLPTLLYALYKAHFLKVGQLNLCELLTLKTPSAPGDPSSSEAIKPNSTLKAGALW